MAATTKSNYYNIRVNRSAKEKVKLLSKRNEKTEKDYVDRMILFVYKSGIDIFSDSSPSVPDLIKGLDKRIVSFLKKREADFFVPMDKSFKEMIKLHTRTFEALEILDPMDLRTQSTQEFRHPKAEKPSLKIPESNSLETPESSDLKTENLEEESQKETGSFSDLEKDDYLDRIERAEKEKNTYEKELKYLIENIIPNKSISGPKFTCNLPQKELDRIKILIGGH